jgi:hypothetical protein
LDFEFSSFNLKSKSKTQKIVGDKNLKIFDDRSMRMRVVQCGNLV